MIWRGGSEEMEPSSDGIFFVDGRLSVLVTMYERLEGVAIFVKHLESGTM